MKRIAVFLFLSLFIFVSLFLSDTSFAEAAGAAKNGSTPLIEVRTTLDGILKIVEALPGDEHRDERRTKLREVINPRFDFEEMARRSLGANWKEATEAQQKEFVQIFSDLLARTYLSKIETVKPGMVKVDSESVEFPRAIVKTSVTNKGDTFPIDYKLMNNDGAAWKVYDVVIENIGLVSNYRNEFAGIIRKEKFDGLMIRLREKTQAHAKS